MKPSKVVVANCAAIRDLVDYHLAWNARDFGLVLYGPAEAVGELHLLVDALPKATGFDLADLEDELESLLGIHVCVLTPADLRLDARAKVLAEARPV